MAFCKTKLVLLRDISPGVQSLWHLDLQTGKAHKVPPRALAACGFWSPIGTSFAAIYLLGQDVHLQVGMKRWQLDGDPRQVRALREGPFSSKYAVGADRDQLEVRVRYRPATALRRLIGTLNDELDAEADDILFFVANNLSADWLERVRERHSAAAETRWPPSALLASAALYTRRANGLAGGVRSAPLLVIDARENARVTDWTEVAAVATAAAAIAGAAAAGVTAWMARETRRVAVSTRDAAAASQATAEATRVAAEATARGAEAALEEARATVAMAEETHRDREYAYQPLLAAEFLSQTGQSHQEVKLVNVGAGPALGALYAVRLLPPNQAWFVSPLVHLSANEERQLRAAARAAQDQRAQWFTRPGQRDADTVIFCRDVLDNRRRSLGYNGHVRHEVRKRDELEDPQAGDWWGDPELWPRDV